MPAYTSREVGDPSQIKKNKQSMADLKLRRLTELNSRLREDLERERIPVSQAAKSPSRQYNRVLQQYEGLHGAFSMGPRAERRRPICTPANRWVLLGHVGRGNCARLVRWVGGSMGEQPLGMYVVTTVFTGERAGGLNFANVRPQPLGSVFPQAEKPCSSIRWKKTRLQGEDEERSGRAPKLKGKTPRWEEMLGRHLR
ncbi:hypothetical protein CHU98_g3014 [Xylaria longipes]|nr:hypothetical protein CHU98_g3014 [Xylaria longipes]